MIDFIGFNIRKIRELSGLTQAEAAELSDISLNSYQRIEIGKNRPKSITLQSIAKALNCPVEVLLGEKLPENFDIKSLQPKPETDPVVDYFKARDKNLIDQIAGMQETIDLKAKLLFTEQQLKIKDEEIRKLTEKISRISALEHDQELLQLINKADKSFLKTFKDALKEHVSKLQKKSNNTNIA